MDKTKLILPGAIIIAALLVSGTILYSNGMFGGPAQQAAVGGPELVEATADDDPFLGSKDAKVEIIEFSDFQCPFCRTFWKNTLGLIKSEYIDSGKVKFVYRDYPLSFHPMAQKYAEAAECAGDQAKYWEMHDKIFSEQDKLGTGTIGDYGVNDVKKWAAELGLNSNDFNQCLDSGEYAQEVGDDFADGSAAGVSGTPSFFVNGRLVVGSQPFESFKQIIDAELQK